MKLYHGTTAKVLSQILAHGLKPRGPGKRGNWNHTIESNPKCVYLTDAYAPYFALVATKGRNTSGLVVEVNSNMLNPFCLLPDEDVLEQVGRGKDEVQGEMKERTRWYRNNIQRWSDGEKWRKSLELMGTCCFYGTMSPKAITRIAVIPPEEMRNLIYHYDCQINLMNYKILAEVYRQKSRRMFGERENFDQLTFNDPRIAYKNIKVLNLADGRVVSEQTVCVPDERNTEKLMDMLNHQDQTRPSGAAS